MPEFWEGIERITEAGKQSKERMKSGAAKGLLTAGRLVLNVSNRQVPHEEGDLERDGGVVITKELGVAITYGRSGDTKDYAVYQHETMQSKSGKPIKHDAGRNAKFLENALNSTKDQCLQIVGQATKAELGT